MEDLIVALKIVSPRSSMTEENKENFIQESNESEEAKGASTDVPMDVETSEQPQQPPQRPNAASEVEMASDVDCSISEND